jgi:hypothetical protein
MNTSIHQLSAKGIALLALLFFNRNSTYAQAGFQNLGFYTEQGVPSYLESQADIIDTLLVKDIVKALPEKKPVPQNHPEYLAGQAETELKITAEADVWVTFVSEGAGWKNSLGFYTYNLTSPPQTVNDITNRTIIFPNVSALGSGGALQAGSRVKIGHFKANTGIGWFLIADGWKNNEITQGNYILYSNPGFNPESAAADRFHTVLLNDNSRNKLILGFEDTRRDQGSDNDFNDVLFYITGNPFTAIKKENIVAIPTPSETPIVTTPASTPNTTSTSSPTTPNNTSTNNVSTVNNTTNVNTSTVSTVNTTNTNNSNNVNTNSNNVITNNTTIINNTTVVTNSNNSNSNNIQSGNGSNPSSNPPHSNSNPGSNSNPNNQNATNQNSSGSTISACSPHGFTANEYTKTYALIRRKPNEDVRVSTIKQAVQGRLLTVNQCSELLRLLDVSSRRLEVAKYLFDYTCEKNNYFMVSQVLTVASHEREFNAFLSTKNRSNPNLNFNYRYTNTGYSRNTTNNTTYTNSTANTNSNCSPTASNELSRSDFESLKSSVSQQSFSDSKLVIIQQAIKNRTLNTVQDIELIKMMSFEQDKIKLAKLLYDFTNDKQNYYQVNAAFTFSSSVDELNKYLSSK